MNETSIIIIATIIVIALYLISISGKTADRRKDKRVYAGVDRRGRTRRQR